MRFYLRYSYPPSAEGFLQTSAVLGSYFLLVMDYYLNIEY